jgi:hypothetical protein
MKLKNVICFLIVIGFLFSCGTDDYLEENFPITLYASEITQISEIKMWVNKKEINDCETRLKFIENADCFNLPNRVEEAEVSIIFLSKDSVVFEFYNFGYTVQKQANQFLFYSKPYVSVENGDIVYPLLKYTDELNSFPLGYVVKRDVIVAYGSYTNFELCFLTYKISKNTEWEWSRAWGTLMNEFNEDAISSLRVLDTLAIQEYKIKFTAK